MLGQGEGVATFHPAKIVAYVKDMKRSINAEASLKGSF
jgi:hypothetical protein